MSKVLRVIVGVVSYLIVFCLNLVLLGRGLLLGFGQFSLSFMAEPHLLISLFGSLGIFFLGVYLAGAITGFLLASWRQAELLFISGSSQVCIFAVFVIVILITEPDQLISFSLGWLIFWVLFFILILEHVSTKGINRGIKLKNRLNKQVTN